MDTTNHPSLTSFASTRPQRVAASSFYFFYYVAAAAMLPYLMVYYQSLGLDGRQIGLLASLPPLVGLFAAPMWSALADATQRHRLLFSLGLAGIIGAAVLIGQAAAFAVLVPVVIGYSLFVAPIMPLMDSAVMSTLGEHKSYYGRVRMWGALGWGLSAPLVGRLIQGGGLAWSFRLYPVLMVLALLAGQAMPLRQAHLSGSFWRSARSLLVQRRWLLFLALALVGGMGLSATSSFLFLYMGDLGATTTLMGLGLTVATLSEVVVMFFTASLLKRFGARGLLVLGLAAFVVRALGYSLAHAAWPILIFQLFHGLTFGGIWVAGVSYADEISPPGLGATAQGLFGSIFMGVGSALGAFIGGQLHESLGGAWMFRLFALIALVSLAVFLFIERRWDQDELTTADNC